jgi:large subunit ribosomal protein L30
MADIRVTQVRSSIGTKPKHRGTLRALGLGRIGKSNTLPDRPEIRGMIAKVPHLIVVDESKGEASTTKATKKRSTGARGVERAEAGEASASAKERP